MSITQKGAATQSQKLMIFVLSMSLYDSKFSGWDCGIFCGILSFYSAGAFHAL